MNETDLEESLLTIARGHDINDLISDFSSEVSLLSQHKPTYTSRPRSAPLIRIGLPVFKPVVYNNPESDSGDESDGSTVSQRSVVSSPTSVVRGRASYSVSIRKPDAGSGVVVRCSSGSSSPKGQLVNIELKKPDQSASRSSGYYSGRSSPMSDVSSLSSIQQECRDYEALVPTFACRLPPSSPDRRAGSRNEPASTSAKLVSYHGASSQQANVRYIPVVRGVESRSWSADSASATRYEVAKQNAAQSPVNNAPSSPSQFISEYRAVPRMSDIRHYQLTPTMDLCGSRSPPTPTLPGGSQPLQHGKEAELDVLTSLLVQNMHAAAEPDFLGMCARCGEPIIGSNAGCTALDQLFHISCFTCVICSENLRDRSFYAMEGRSYCETCYLNTLEKCQSCQKPIVDRLLRAAGKPYHPHCFNCVVCAKNLDGTPFTIDSAVQIYCIDDFNRKYSPRCAACGDPIVADNGQDQAVRIVSMDRSYHVNCFKCEDCNKVLTQTDGGGCYPLDRHLLCRGCNAQRIQHMSAQRYTEL